MEIVDKHEVFKIYSSDCGRCKLLNSVDFTCKAFPKGIPDDLLSGKLKHREPIKGQVGEFILDSVRPSLD